MSELKCPFCQQELKEIYCYGVVMGYLCPNPDCKPVFKGNKELWQELTKTKQMLGDVFNALDPVSQEYFRATFPDRIKQITESRPVNVQK